MGSVACFLVLSLLLAHKDLATSSSSILTMQQGVLGVGLALGLALAAWPDGQTAHALGSLGCFLMAMVGFSEKIWPLFLGSMTLILWICRPLFLITDEGGKKRSSQTNRLRFALLLALFLVALLDAYGPANSLSDCMEYIKPALNFSNFIALKFICALMVVAVFCYRTLMPTFSKKASWKNFYENTTIWNLLWLGLILFFIYSLPYNFLFIKHHSLEMGVICCTFLWAPTFSKGYAWALEENFHKTNILGQFLWAVLFLCSIYCLPYITEFAMKHAAKDGLSYFTKRPFFEIGIMGILSGKISSSFQIFKKGYGALPLSEDRKALCTDASPEWIAFWDPWQRLNGGLYELLMWFMAGTLSLVWIANLEQTPLVLKPQLTCIILAFSATALLTMFHVYAVFQPRFVPHRFALMASMGCCMAATPGIAWPFFLWPPTNMHMSEVTIIAMCGMGLWGIVLWRILRPLMWARRCAAILNPNHLEETKGSELSRGWTLGLLAAFVLWGVGLHSAGNFKMALSGFL